jgi:hypothetical protein
VYWCDESGSLFVERQDERVVELRHVEEPPEKRKSVLGLAANSAHVYVGYAYGGFGDYGTLSYRGPGRLLSISKQDGQATVLLAAEQGWFAPISADDERLIVFAWSQGIGFYQVPLDHPRLEPLPLGTVSSRSGSEPSDSDALHALWDLFVQGQLVGDQVYWRSFSTPPLGLLRSGFDDAQPELLSDSFPTDVSFSAGPGYILTLQRARDAGYHDIGLNFVRTDDSGCRSVPGPRGEALADVALDATHAYWIGTRTAGSNAAIGQNTLNRVDLETGAVARLNLPGIMPDYYRSFLAQDDTRLFLSSDGALLSVRKPWGTCDTRAN